MMEGLYRFLFRRTVSVVEDPFTHEQTVIEADVLTGDLYSYGVVDADRPEAEEVEPSG